MLLPETSKESATVLMQLMKAKEEMGSGVKKDSSNPFHKSKYASLAAHLELSEEILSKHGLIMLQTINQSDGKDILISALYHPESGQWIKSYLPLPNVKGDSQGVGASITYMRRYSINAMLGLTAEDDDGETAAGRGQYDKQQQKKERQTPEKTREPSSSVEAIESFLTAHQMKDFKDRYQLTDNVFKENFQRHMKDKWNLQENEIFKMPIDQYNVAMQAIENNIKKNNLVKAAA